MSVFAVSNAAEKQETHGVSPDEALKKLMQGNRRFVAAEYTHPNQSAERRSEVAKGQHPVAGILSCADSRVPPEIVFDQGMGDLFVVRVAGNMPSPNVLGSLEYAVEHLGVNLIVVLGHERCGAVDAAVKGGQVPGHIASLVEAIRPAVAEAKGRPGDLLDNAVRANIEMVVEQLTSKSHILAESVHEGKLKIVGARYDLDTGMVAVRR